MLPPDARLVLTDALRPPPGAVVERAVALTFTLDLESALVVPLAFAAHAVQETNDPLTIMESIRGCADRVDIFCQTGHISVPSVSTDLHAFLEKMVHPVRRPRPGRLFHPKLWAVRFWDEANGTYLARLLVLSRNLTPDRSWDACLRLDGTVSTRRQASNRPLADLINHAMSLAIDLPDERRTGVAALVEDLRRVEWELPDGVSELTFHAMGIPGPSRPDFAGSRHLVITPFCDAEGVTDMAPSADVVLVGRQEELDRLPEATLEGSDVHVVSEMAGLPPEDASASQGILTGLHAKLYIVEQGWNARLFIGSANATGAAFGGNTEFLVELAGRRKTLGVDTMIGADAAFRTILEPYQRQPSVERDEDKWRLENFLRDVASIALTATVQPGDDAYLLTVTGERDLPSIEGMGLLAELLTRRGEAVRLSPGTAMWEQFGPLPITDITPFVVLTAEDDGGRSQSTVVRASLIGDPSGRLDEILARQVDTPEKFLRFLALLLGLGSEAILPEGTGGANGKGSWTGVASPGILELLMSGLVDQPKQLDDLARLVERLSKTERGLQLLPTGFAELWAVIDPVRRELGETRTS